MWIYALQCVHAVTQQSTTTHTIRIQYDILYIPYKVFCAQCFLNFLPNAINSQIKYCIYYWCIVDILRVNYIWCITQKHKHWSGIGVYLFAIGATETIFLSVSGREANKRDCESLESWKLPSKVRSPVALASYRQASNQFEVEWIGSPRTTAIRSSCLLL